MKKPHIVRFMEWDCTVMLAHYSNKRIALQLNDAHDGEPVVTATVNIPEIPLKDDEVLIKDYSENEGMLELLIREGIVEKLNQIVFSGYVEIPKCKLLIGKKDFQSNILMKEI